MFEFLLSLFLFFLSFCLYVLLFIELLEADWRLGDHSSCPSSSSVLFMSSVFHGFCKKQALKTPQTSTSTKIKPRETASVRYRCRSRQNTFSRPTNDHIHADKEGDVSSARPCCNCMDIWQGWVLLYTGLSFMNISYPALSSALYPPPCCVVMRSVFALTPAPLLTRHGHDHSRGWGVLLEDSQWIEFVFCSNPELIWTIL